MHTELDPTRRSLDRTRRSRLSAVLIGAALLTLGGAGTTAYADDPGPQLSIAVDNGSTTAKDGDELAYTITISNLGAHEVEDLRVSQTVPAGASFVSADADGDHAKGTVSWSVDLKATGKATMHTTLALGTTPDSTLRLASVACASLSVKGPPLVCASDSDQLPAGAAAAAAEVAKADTDVPSTWLDGRTPWYAGGGAALVGVLVGALVLVRRHRLHGLADVGSTSTPDVR